MSLHESVSLISPLFLRHRTYLKLAIDSDPALEHPILRGYFDSSPERDLRRGEFPGQPIRAAQSGLAECEELVSSLFK
jgi:hypothetical protein